MLRICSKGHYELTYNDSNRFHEAVPCPACDIAEKLERLQDEIIVILDELARYKSEEESKA